MESAQPAFIEVPEPRSGRRRRFSNAEKRTILNEAVAEGQSVSSVGRRYGLSVSLLFRWKRQLDELEGISSGRVSSRAVLNRRLADLELQLDAAMAENAILRETLERSRREGRVPSLPVRPGASL